MNLSQLRVQLLPNICIWYVVSAPCLETIIRRLSSVLCVYEHLLTLDQEIVSIWKNKVSVVSFLFVINRYACLCYNAVGLVALVVWDSHGSRGADKVSNTCLNLLALLTLPLDVESNTRAHRSFSHRVSFTAAVLWDKSKMSARL